ncbi:site-specific recombinase XerD [Aquimarina sp. MAR_2010_214]|uniref:tyrosine-type recombinase/integrase n=1 Tax=Aquimarina sp. MAR_2010_214 TaxID=1250026 RepID=UPI000C6FCEE9|nr:site-specific integrase [Aquimarina sp. MAR_2010_214]PKV50195.1 site-specific recombinase XerD [Aquimarina sp. MAR_2010_214]
MHKFKKARLIKSKAAKGNYIMYYVWDVQKNDLVRKRLYIPKKYKSDEEELAFAKDRIKEINKLLVEGYHIDRKKVSRDIGENENTSTQTIFSVREAVNRFIEIKKAKKLYKRGIGFYSNTLERFLNWLEGRGVDNVWVGELDYQLIQEYFFYLLSHRKNSAKTYNNTLGVLKTFYNLCLKQEWVEGKNPFDKIEKLPNNYGSKNKPFTDKQIADIKEYTLENDPYLWKIICFVYYSFMRPSEIRRLKVQDIDLEKDLIWVSGETSKTKKRDVLPIVPGLKRVILEMNLENYSSDDYLFSANQAPSSIKMGENYTGKHFRKVKDHFEFGSDYTLYGFKHTAVVNWYQKEKDIRKIQKMCRHSSMLMTERYLKSLGLLDDKNAVSELPEI